MIKQSSKRFASMTLSVVFLVAALLVFFELIQPSYGNVETLKGTQLSTQAFLQKETDLVNQAKQLVSQYQTESQTQDNLALAMPSGPNVAAALAQLYGIAQNNGIIITGMSITPPTVQLAQSGSSGSAQGGAAAPGQIIKPMGSISIQAAAAGSYENMKNFLSQLETNLRIFDLTGFSIQAQAAGVVVASGTAAKAAPGTQDFFGYDFTVKTYFQLP